MQFKQFLILVSILLSFGISWSACGGETSTTQEKEQISSTTAAASTAPVPTKEDTKPVATEQAKAEEERLAKESAEAKEKAKKEKEEKRRKEKKAEKKKRKKRAKMVFPEKVHDYGFIMQGDVVKHDFYFKNIGDDDLVITRVKASCGCTVPVYPREPIPPGEDGKISVTFKSAGKLGRQVPNIQVYTNYQRKFTLELKGFVDAERAKPPQVTEAIPDSIQ